MSTAVHAVVAGLIAVGVLPADTPEVPDSEVPADLVTPGVLGFVITAGIAIVTILLILDMSRRVRRARYRGEVAEVLAAERAAAAAAAEPPDADRPAADR